MKIITCLLAVLCCVLFSCKNNNTEPGAAAPGVQPPDRVTPLSIDERLTGIWISASDKQYEVEFTSDHKFYGKYQGKMVEEGKWRGLEVCECKMPIEKGCIMMSTTEIFCNVILDLTPTTLSYKHDDGAGKEQVYTRKE